MMLRCENCHRFGVIPTSCGIWICVWGKCNWSGKEYKEPIINPKDMKTSWFKGKEK